MTKQSNAHLRTKIREDFLTAAVLLLLSEIVFLMM